jgi:hypothetical protein
VLVHPELDPYGEASLVGNYYSTIKIEFSADILTSMLCFYVYVRGAK